MLCLANFANIELEVGIKLSNQFNGGFDLDRRRVNNGLARKRKNGSIKVNELGKVSIRRHE